MIADSERPTRLARLLPALAAVLLLLGLAGCGDSDDDDGGGTATSSGKIDLKGSDAEPEATLGGRIAGGQFGPNVTLKGTEGAVLVRAEVENADEGPLVRMTVPKGPTKKLQVTVGGSDGKPAGTVTIDSASKAKLQVLTLRYSCSLPPRTFCPVSASESGDAHLLEFVPAEGVPATFELQVRGSSEGQGKGAGKGK